MTEGELHGNNGDVARYTFFSVQEDKLAVSYFFWIMYIGLMLSHRLRPDLNGAGVFAGFWCSFVAIDSDLCMSNCHRSSGNPLPRVSAALVRQLVEGTPESRPAA